MFVKNTIARDNHKPAQEDPDTCHRLSKSDVDLGYTLLLPVSCVDRIRNAEVYPVSIMYAMKLQPDGTYKEKCHLTHDLSNLKKPRGGTPLSINARTDQQKLQPCIFGFSF